MMNKKNLKTLFYSLAFIGVIGALYSFTTHKITTYTQLDQPQWENLKVLPQDISEDSLKQVMKGFTNALGVDCSHCHATQKDNPKKMDFSSDDKIEKEIARGMMEMTADINEKYFKPHFPEPQPDEVNVVGCVMCHRGTSNPERYLGNMESMYKKYNPKKDDRKKMILEQREKK